MNSTDTAISMLSDRKISPHYDPVQVRAEMGKMRLHVKQCRQERELACHHYKQAHDKHLMIKAHL